MGLSIGGGSTTNGEARTMAAIACGVDPDEVCSFVIIARTYDRTQVATDECAPHAIQMITEALSVISDERMKNPAADEHDWTTGRYDD